MSEKTNAPDDSEEAGQNTPPSTGAAEPPLDSAEYGTSLASKVLTGLVLLVSGGVIALWAGPQIAPHLPAGLSSVAEFFAPQAETETDLKLTELEDAQRAFENRVIARFDDFTQNDQNLRADLAELRSAARTSQSSGSSAAEVARLDAAIDDLRDRLAQLAVRLETMPVNTSTALTSEIAQTENDVAVLRAEVTRLAQEQTNLAMELSTAQANLDARLTTAQSEMATVTQAAQIQVGSAQNRQLVVELERALNSGEPFLALVNNTEVVFPPALTKAATNGVATLTDLKSRYTDLAHDAIRADITANAKEGTLGRLSAFLQKQVAVRSLEPQEGNGTDAILSRIDRALANDDLDRVLSEASELSLAPKEVLRVWLDDIKERQDAFMALAAFAAEG